jgi:predicted ester cyclase
MSQLPFSKVFIAILFAAAFIFPNCTSHKKVLPANTDQLEANKKMYTHVWDEILNKGKIETFNDSNWVKNAVVHANPNDIVGIDSIKAYYGQFLTGFSNIQFTVKDIFGEGDKMVKFWNFKGTHTGLFFGIPATNKSVSIDGTTLIKMENGKIGEEQDFFDNLDFMTQLGVIPAGGK